MSQTARLHALRVAFWQASETLLFHHTNPWELDEALEEFGYATGPCLAQDLQGLDVLLGQQAVPVSPVLPRMVAEGRHGKKVGVGFYRYPGGGGAVIDPLIEDLIREEAWFAKCTRVELASPELVARMNAALAQACTGLPAPEDWAEVLAEAVGFPMEKLSVLGLQRP